MIFLYNILFPLAFVFFLPGMIFKLIRRPGYKSTFPERFAVFSARKKKRLKEFEGAVWVHSVSVGETVAALSFIRKYSASVPGQKFVISTTTTTGQELAQKNAPDNCAVIFCPLDFIFFVKRVLSLLKPSKLVILETEIWPNLILESKKSGAEVYMINARMSDKSVRGYLKFRKIIAPIISVIDKVCVQSQLDAERFMTVAPDSRVTVTGNMKFDQVLPESFPSADYGRYFGEGDYKIILAASTHSGEEKLAAEVFQKLRNSYPDLKLVLVPRHAERAAEVAEQLRELKLSFVRKTQFSSGNSEPVDCLLADTTGEMLMLMNDADIIIMGKTLAGHDEGHNLIEPALLAKPVVCGRKLSNFRVVFDILKKADALITVSDGRELLSALERLLSDPDYAEKLGSAAYRAITVHKGAIEKNIAQIKDRPAE